MNYDNKSRLLIDLINFWQTYKQRKTQTGGGWQNIEILGAGLSIQGELKQFLVEGVL